MKDSINNPSVGFLTALTYIRYINVLIDDGMTWLEGDKEGHKYIRDKLSKFLDDNAGKVLYAVCEGYLNLNGEYWKEDRDLDYDFDTGLFPSTTPAFWRMAEMQGVTMALGGDNEEVIELEDYKVDELLDPVKPEFVFD